MLETQAAVLEAMHGVGEDDENLPVEEIFVDGVIPHGVYELCPDVVFGRLKRVVLNLVGIPCPPGIPGSVKLGEVHYLPWKDGDLPAGSVHACNEAGWRNVGSDADNFRRKSRFSIPS